MRLLGGLIATAAVGLALTAPAMGGTSATRYAEPGGDGPSPCLESNPCEIQNAVETVASTGDTVFLLPGTYALGNDELQIGDSVDVVGQNGGDVTTLTSTATVGARVLFASPSSSIADVTLDHDTDDAQSVGLAVENGVAERVYVDSTGDSACTNIALIRDSICVNSDPNIGNGIATVSGSAATGTLRNVTAIALGTTSGNALFASATGAGDFLVTMHGRNVIAQGATTDQRGFDSNINTASSHIDLDFSNFDTINFLPATGASGTGVDAFDNQSALPQLDPSTYRQQPGSPTIDAGDATVTNIGTLDIDLDPRVQGNSPDIGADESDGTVPDTEINKKPKKRTKKRTGAFEFSSDEDGVGFECKIDVKPFQPCDSGAVKYKRLKRKKHTFQVRADDGFNVDPDPATYSWKIRKKR